MPIPVFDMDRTITFADAMDRVKELYPMINGWKQRLQMLYGLRNEIVHYGAAAKQDAAYAEAVANIAFPFLTKFLQEAQGISLEKAITAAVFRELQVARAVFEQLKAHGRDGGSWALITVGHTMLYTYVDWPTRADSAGCVREVELAGEYEMAEVMRKELSSAWEDSFIERACRICDAVPSFVRVQPLTPNRRSLAVTAVRCPKCDLAIRDNHPYLAECHVGPLSNEEVETFLKDIGE